MMNTKADIKENVIKAVNEGKIPLRACSASRENIL